MAIQRLEFILTAEPNFPSAAQRYNDLQATTRANRHADSAPDPDSSCHRARRAQSFSRSANGDQRQRLGHGDSKINALRFGAPSYEPLRVNNLLYTALRNRGVNTIQTGSFELGLTDLDEASKIGSLDTEALQYQQWATIYINGVSYWGLNWQRTTRDFDLLYKLAPNFRDTKTRARDAHLTYASILIGKNDSCNAVLEYAAAFAVENNQVTDDRRKAAEETCKASGGSVSTKTP